jgi:hypothetical protein
MLQHPRIVGYQSGPTQTSDPLENFKTFFFMERVFVRTDMIREFAAANQHLGTYTPQKHDVFSGAWGDYLDTHFRPLLTAKNPTLRKQLISDLFLCSHIVAPSTIQDEFLKELETKGKLEESPGVYFQLQGMLHKFHASRAEHLFSR